MLRARSGPTANKSISGDSIDKIDGDKVIVRAIGKRSTMRFLTPKAKLAFVELK